jgi:hypothetical protein
MRLEFESRIDCTDDTWGVLAAVAVEPTAMRVTHLIVDPRHHEERLARLVPVELAEGESGLTLRATVDEVTRFPAAHDVGFMGLGDFADDPEWDVGVQTVLTLPVFNPPADLEPTAVDFAVAYDRIPRGEIELRHESSAWAADGLRVGHVDGMLLGEDRRITHLLLRHLRHEFVVPTAAVVRLETDSVTVALTREETWALG